MTGTPPSIERDKPEREQAIEDHQEEIMRFGVSKDPMQKTPLPEPEKAKYDTEQTDTVIKRVMDLPFELKAHEAKLYALNQKEDYINKRSNEIKERIYLNVMNEKAVGEFRYPDTTSQDKEILKRLQNDKLWIQKWSEIYNKVNEEMTLPTKKKSILKKLYTSETARKAETTKKIQAESDINDIKRFIWGKVVEERLDGKPAFSNEKAREIEVNNRLHDHEEYQNLMTEQKYAVAETHKTKADIYCLRGEFKSIEIVTEIMKIKLRII